MNITSKNPFIRRSYSINRMSIGPPPQIPIRDMTSSITSSSWLKATQVLTNMHTPISQQTKQKRQALVLLDSPITLLHPRQ